MIYLEETSEPAPSSSPDASVVSDLIVSPVPSGVPDVSVSEEIEKGSDSQENTTIEMIDYSDRLDQIISNQEEILKCDSVIMMGVAMFIGVYLVSYLFHKI